MVCLSKCKRRGCVITCSPNFCLMCCMCSAVQLLCEVQKWDSSGTMFVHHNTQRGYNNYSYFGVLSFMIYNCWIDHP